MACFFWGGGIIASNPGLFVRYMYLDKGMWWLFEVIAQVSALVIS